jgi:hypothetical protein
MGLLDSLRKYCVMKKVREKSTDSEKKKSEQEEMKEEQHQLDLKENYESDEEFEESKD